MPDVALVTDTTHYLPRELVARNEIHEVSLYVNWPDSQQPSHSGAVHRLKQHGKRESGQSGVTDAAPRATMKCCWGRR